MSEVADASVQLVIFQVATRIYRDSDLTNPMNAITKGTLWRLGDFGYARDILKELCRVLKTDGFLVLHLGALPYMQSSRICLEFMGLRTGLAPIIDFHVVYPEEETIIQARLHNLVDHFFIFSQTKDIIDMDHSISVSTPRPKLGSEGINFGWFSLFHENVIEYLITHLSKEGDWILDPLAGSGVFGKVADALNRNCYLYEINCKLYPLIADTLVGHPVEYSGFLSEEK